jgi:hypothetical protein
MVLKVIFSTRQTLDGHPLEMRFVENKNGQTLKELHGTQ